MKFRVKDLGDERWYMLGFSKDHQEENEFVKWMTIHFPDCMFVKRSNYGDKPFWEIRGGDKRQQTLILLRWST